MSYLFFLSYARDNNDTDEVGKFFEDLSAELLRQLGAKQNFGKIGFRDQNEKPGVEWERGLLDALQNSCMLICLYSPAYFYSDWCGREWEVFRLRQELFLEDKRLAGQANPVRPPVIVPIIWMAGGMLEAVANIQAYSFDTPGDVYRVKGLFRLIRQYDKYQHEYDDFIFQLAGEILSQEEIHLPPLPAKYTLLSQVNNAFCQADPPLNNSGDSQNREAPHDPVLHSRKIFVSYTESSTIKRRRLFITLVSIFICAVLVALFAYAIDHYDRPHSPTAVELADNLDNRIEQWMPTSLGWSVETLKGARGRVIRGDAVGLFMTSYGKTQTMNFYQGFKLEFDIRFTGKQGVSWIVRAKDFNNYYLLELTKAGNGLAPSELNFYLCEQGRRPVLLKSARAEVNVADDQDNISIITDAQGSNFDISIRSLLSTETGYQKLMVVTDQTFPYGGVGLLPKNGKEVLLQQWRVEPH